jgi:hypothetical protein
MPSTTETTASPFSRIAVLPNPPAIIDVRADEELASDPGLDWQRGTPEVSSIESRQIQSHETKT